MTSYSLFFFCLFLFGYFLYLFTLQQRLKFNEKEKYLYIYITFDVFRKSCLHIRDHLKHYYYDYIHKHGLKLFPSTCLLFKLAYRKLEYLFHHILINNRV